MEEEEAVAVEVRVTVGLMDRSDYLLASMSSHGKLPVPHGGRAMPNQQAPRLRRGFLFLWTRMLHQSALSSVFPS